MAPQLFLWGYSAADSPSLGVLQQFEVDGYSADASTGEGYARGHGFYDAGTLDADSFRKSFIKAFVTIIATSH